MSSNAVCHSCANEVDDQNIACQGFCSAIFHPQCTNLPAALLAEAVKNKQLFWLCKSCSGLMSDMRMRRSVQTAYAAGQNQASGSQSHLFEQLKSDVLTEMKKELKQSFAALVNSNSLTPMSGQRNNGAGGKPWNGRQLFKNQQSRQNPPDPSTVATGIAASPSLGSIVANDSSTMFQLYLSRISRNVTVEQVSKLATDRLGCSDLEVTRLVGKGKDVSRMSFISFKIGMKKELKTKALARATWPAGLIVREFEDRTAGKFWDPSTDTPTTSADLLNSVTTTPLRPQTSPAGTDAMSE